MGGKDSGYGKALLQCLKPVAGFTNLGPKAFFVGRPFRILALSGGGANGAYGAGVIAGWHQHPGRNPAPLAQIDMITGVSTGAIQALFLAAARGAANPAVPIQALAAAYLHTDDSKVFNNRWPLPLALLLRLSRADARPLRDRLTAMVTAHLQDLNNATQAGLEVYFGTVMLEDGGLYAASLADLLALPNPVAAIVDVVMASAAVPIDYPPVEIGGRLFVDGGIRHTSFICEVVWQVLQQIKRAGELDVLLIRNGTNSPNGCSSCDAAPASAAARGACVSATAEPTRPRHLLGLLMRAINEVMTNQIELGSQYRIAGDLALIAARHPQIRTNLWLSHLSNIDLEQRGIRRPKGRVFDPGYMQAIFNFGEQRAKWDASSCTIPNPMETHKGAFMRIDGPGFAFDDTVPIEKRRCP